MQCNSSAVQWDLVSDALGVSHGQTGGRVVSRWCNWATISVLSIQSRGAVDFPLFGGAGSGMMYSTAYNRWISLSWSRSLKLLVYVDGEMRDISIGGCCGEGGCLGQCDANLGV
jgi:hypothetical protein